MPDLRVEPVAAAENGDTLFIQFRCAGTFAERRVEWDGVDRFDFPPGSAQAFRGVGFFDTAPVREAVLGPGSGTSTTEGS